MLQVLRSNSEMYDWGYLRMAMLDRYRKPGGFVQLLSLIETCGPQKQKQFLDIIQTEDSRWADEIKKKMLTIERIYSWNDETLAEIFGTLQDLTVAVALQAGDDKLRVRINTYFSHGRKRKIEDLSINKPTPGEIATMHLKIIESVRKMEQDGYLRFEKIDQQLEILEDIEDRLSKATAVSEPVSSLHLVKPETEETQTTTVEATGMSEAQMVEMQTLKKKVAELSKENAVLRHELSVSKNKLEQIKKIA